jgi:cyclic nucleotide gated channel
VIGSIWYVFGLERIDTCWHEACNGTCADHQFACNRKAPLSPSVNLTINNNCNNEQIAFGMGNGRFDFGIYMPLLLLIQDERGWQNYLYSFWWGLQQIW